MFWPIGLKKSLLEGCYKSVDHNLCACVSLTHTYVAISRETKREP